MKIKRICLILLMCPFCFGMPAEEFQFIVNFFMLPSLDMRMEIYRDVDYQGEVCNRIKITTKTKRVFDRLFAIDNQYETIYSAKDYRCKYHEKIILQPNVKQRLSISYCDSLATYSTGETRPLDQQVLDFFSLLMYMRTLSGAQLINEQLMIDLEGEIFEVTFTLENEDLLKVGKEKVQALKVGLIFHKLYISQQSVLDYTDIFFWKIAEESGSKYIWLEKGGQKRILKARFSDGGSWLEAKLIHLE